MWRGEINFGVGSVFPRCGFLGRIQVGSLGSERLYPLNHLTGPGSSFFEENVVVAVLDHRSHDSFMSLGL